MENLYKEIVKAELLGYVEQELLTKEDLIIILEGIIKDLKN